MEDLTRRVTALEAEVGLLRQETAGARALAAGADREISDYRAEMRGHTRTLSALRETQLEQGQAILEQRQAIAALGERVTRLDDKVTRLDDKVDQLTGTVGHLRDQHGASLNQIVGLLNHLIDRDGGQN